MAGSFRSLRTPKRVRPHGRLELEALEAREVPALITVTNLTDLVQTGDGISIREALNSINSGSAVNADVTFTGTFGTEDEVRFDPDVTGTINTTTQLDITRAVTVTGPGLATLALNNTGAAGANSRVLNVNSAGAVVTVSGLTIRGGNTTSSGGGIFVGAADLRLNNVSVRNNTTTARGGGISLNLATSRVTLTDSIVQLNSSTVGDGGGINVQATGGTLNLLRSTISGNTAGKNGGGVYFFLGGTMVMDNSTISGNTAPGDGGGMYLWSPTVTIRNSTISGNSGGIGGAFAIKSTSTVTVENSTIAQNTATNAAGTNSAGGITRTATTGTLTLTSTIVSNNTGGATTENVDLNIAGGTVNGNNNLVRVRPAAVTMPGTNNLTGTAAAPLANVNLSPTLAANSGTTFTHALLAGSVAINAGSGTSPDQRGFAPIGIRDIGAFEFTPPPTPPSFTSASSTTFVVGTPGSFTITTNGFPLPAITLFSGGPLPAGLTLTDNGNGTATLAGTPALGTGGIRTLSLRATNLVAPGVANQTFTLRINEALRFTTPPTATFVAGTTNSFVVSTAGFPTAALSVTSVLPPGITFTDNGNGTGTIAGTPLVASEYSLSLRGTNGIGADALQAFSLKVVLAPAITSVSGTTFTLGVASSFQVSAVGAPLPALSVTGPLPGGVTFVDNGYGNGTFAGVPTEAGRFSVVLTAANGISPDATQTFTLSVLPAAVPPVTPPTVPPVAPPTVPPVAPPVVVVPQPAPLPQRFTRDNILAVTPGSSAAGTELRVIDPVTESPLFTVVPFPGYRGGMHTASGDVNGDGVADYAVGAGIGGGPHVVVYDGRTMAQLASFFAFDEFFTGGVSLAIGDVTGDGLGDLIVAAGPGGGPHVKAFAGPSMALVRSLFAYDPAFAGGVNVAAGDLNGDGRDEIITAAKSGGGPHVKAFDALSLEVVQSFFAYDPAFTGGVSVAAGDLNGDGKDEIITAAGVGGGPHVRTFDGGTGAELGGFLAYDAAFTGGVNVAAGDLNGDGLDEIITGVGVGGGPHLKAFDGRGLLEVKSFFPTSPLFRNGVMVS
jgi:hypothetical protein